MTSVILLSFLGVLLAVLLAVSIHALCWWLRGRAPFLLAVPGGAASVTLTLIALTLLATAADEVRASALLSLLLGWGLSLIIGVRYGRLDRLRLDQAVSAAAAEVLLLVHAALLLKRSPDAFWWLGSWKSPIPLLVLPATWLLLHVTCSGGRSAKHEGPEDRARGDRVRARRGDRLPGR